jgi:hypothetical protein
MGINVIIESRILGTVVCKRNLRSSNMFPKIITKLPNSEQSNKGKVKTHKYTNRQNQSTTGKL